MKTKNVENIVNVIPDIIKNAIEYSGKYLQDNKDDILNVGGTAGIILKLFAKPLLDKYFEQKSEKKLANFGTHSYIKASLIQADKSIEYIYESLDKSLSPGSVFKILNDSINEEILKLATYRPILVFQPHFHPVVIRTKELYTKLLIEIDTPSSAIDDFLLYYNKNISLTISETFGEDYDKHLDQIKRYSLKDAEVNYLMDIIELDRIGFKKNENLRYEQTFGEWKQLSELKKNVQDPNLQPEEIEKYEKSLKPVEQLIEEYFSREPENHLEKILFIVADFGKGKSVFLKHYASQIASEYLRTHEGYFPVYFNLRDFSNFSSGTTYGVLSDFLESKYSIKIDSDYFKQKRFVFLVDSLDESGELNRSSIQQVIESIKRIQNIDKTLFRANKIIISTRPFDDGLEQQLCQHRPFFILNKEGRDIIFYLSLYGFKKSQFNEWLTISLKQSNINVKIGSKGFRKIIIEKINKNEKVDIYKELSDRKTLSPEELKRPIFAYMIYQLFLNELDFYSVGKIGVYLSFLNLLTKEAKYIHDPSYRINLNEQFEARNILHATAALWMYEKQTGKHGTLKKADLCRVIEGINNNESDEKILERFNKSPIKDLDFLSHSYFGESNNNLHFQHQSFAEILLAEYYLKVFITYSLDKDKSTEEARIKLLLGEPTSQTIDFLKDLLKLLKDSSQNKLDDEILEKRKLLFPFLASISTSKKNTLFSNELYYKWFNTSEIPENSTEIPELFLKKWYINNQAIQKIEQLSQNILESNVPYLLTRSEPQNPLFDNEAIRINDSLTSQPVSIDKWLALLVGNVLNTDAKRHFTSKIKQFNNLINLIKEWHFIYNQSSPNWGKALFKGLNLIDNFNMIDFTGYNLSGIDFSDSYLANIKAENAILDHCCFDNVTFSNFQASFSSLFNCSFSNIQIRSGPFNLAMSTIKPGIFIPYQMCEKFVFKENKYSKKDDLLAFFFSGIYNNLGSIKTIIGNENLNRIYRVKDSINELFTTLQGLFIFGIKNNYFTKNEINNWFEIPDQELKTRFFKMIDDLTPDPEVSIMGKMKRIIIVEDEPQWINLVKDELHDYFELEISTNFSDAHHIISSDNKPDAILLDIMLPADKNSRSNERGAGIRLIELLNEQQTSMVPVIIFSSYLTEFREEMINLGVHSFISKSTINPGELLKTINQAIQNSDGNTFIA